MRITMTSKLLALAGLTSGSFVVAYLAINHRSEGNISPPQEQPTGETVEVRNASPLPPTNGRTVLRTAASYSTVQPMAVFDGEDVIVGASATIRDSQPNNGYVWAVHVFSNLDIDRKDVLFEHWFEDQPIKVNGDTSVKATLFERISIPLPLGDYRVTVGAYRVPADTGIAGLKGKSVSRLIKGLEGPTLFTLARF